MGQIKFTALKTLNQYEYKPKWTSVFFIGGFFAICASVFVCLAVADNPGMTSGSKAFYWVMAGLSITYVIAAGFIAYMRLKVVQRIAITPYGILLPVSRWTARETHVSFDSITDVRYLEMKNQLILVIYAGGRRYTVVKNMLPDKGDFVEIASILEERTRKDRNFQSQL